MGNGGVARMRGRPADVLVVGAGPAGSSLAHHLGRAGVRTLLLDARPFPRSKPCGDAVSPGALPLLEELGVLASLERLEAARIEGWRIRAQDGSWFAGAFRAPAPGVPSHGVCAPRSVLDALLLEAAAGAGAAFLPLRRVFDLAWASGGAGGQRRERNGPAARVAGVLARGPDGSVERYDARLVVGTDGLRSRVARLLGGVRRGPRRRLALVARFEGLPGPPRFGEMRLGADGVLGWAPIGPDRSNLTLVVPESRAREISGDAAGFYGRALKAYGMAHRLNGARRVGELEVTGPFQIAPRRITAPGAILVGDAAGYFDPFTGQGIYQALVGGRLAAGAVFRILERPEREAAERRRYEAELARFLWPSRRLQRLIDAFVGRPAAMVPAARVLARRPALASLLVDATGDRLPPSAVASPRRLLRALLGPASSDRRRCPAPALGDRAHA